MEAPNAWELLDPLAREALGWAAAMESLDVGTRTVLIGLIKVGEGKSDPEQLLRVFGCPKERLFDALQDAAPRPTIRPYVSKPAQLDGLPRLSPNCKQALERAIALRQLDGSELVGPRHLFAALLDFRLSTAYRALREVLNVEIPELRAIYLDHLRDPDRGSFAERLRRRYPGAGENRGKVISVHQGAVTALSFDPRRSELISAGADGVVQALSFEEEGPPVKLPGTLSLQWGVVAHSPDGEYAAAGSADGLVTVWRRLGDWRVFHTFQIDDGNAIDSIAFSSHGLMAIGASDGNLTVLDLGEEVPTSNRYRVDGVGFVALDFALDGGELVSLNREGVMALWDVETGEVERTHAFQGEGALSLRFQRNGREVLYVRGDGSVGVWEPREEEVRALTGESEGGAATAAVLALEVACAVTMHIDGAIRFSPFGDGRSRTRVLNHYLAPVRSLAMASRGDWIAAGDADGGVQIWQAPGSVVDVGVDWQTDSPVASADRDKLGREQLAGALARRLRHVASDGSEESFLLHVDGPWGVGKSTVLKFLEAELRDGSPSFLVVNFDAWRQSRVGPPWWALLTSLRNSLRGSLDLRGRTCLRAAEVFHRLRKAWLSNLISLLILVVAFVAFVLTGASGGSLAQGIQLFSGTVAVLASIWVVGGAVARSLLWESATGARLYEESHQNPMESLAGHFAWLMRKSAQRVVFFLDDVDRCDSEYVVDLLDSVQTLVRDASPTGSGDGGKSPYFVVAADGRWIRCSYESVYETFGDAVREAGRPLGYLFLDKIFQLTVRIPTLGQEQQRGYLDHLLRLDSAGRRAPDPSLVEDERRIRESRSQNEILNVVDAAPVEVQPALRAVAAEQLATSEVVEQTEHELQKFSRLLEPNPRSMKRFVNAYSVALSSALLEERSVEPDHVALWVIVTMRWPELAEFLSLHPGKVETFKSTGEGARGSVPEKMAPLVGDRMVIEALSFGRRPFGESAIRSLSGSHGPPPAEESP